MIFARYCVNKPLPKFVQDSFKRSIINKSKSSPALPSQPPIESEEIRLAASIIDKAKRTIENVGEKKSKPSPIATTTVSASNQASTTQTNRSKTSSSVRPSSASSAVPPVSDSSLPQKQPSQSVRRYMPAHMKAPFLTQPEKKRRSNSSVRTSSQANINQKPNMTIRSSTQQRRQSSSSISQSVAELPQKVTSVSSNPTSVQNEQYSTVDFQISNDMNDAIINSEQPSLQTATEEPTHITDETKEPDELFVPQSIILNRALVKPLRRLSKQNQNLRLRLELELNKKTTSSPPSFISRLNEQIHSVTNVNEIRIPNIDVLLQLSTKLRTIILHLLENSTFDDLDGALKRLNTLKYFINQYRFFFDTNINILVEKYDHRPLNINLNLENCLTKSKSASSNGGSILRYTDDSQLIAFTEVRFKLFENECRSIELNWHKEMIMHFKQAFTNPNLNRLQIYRELMCLVTGLQTSTPIVVENRFE